MNKADLIEQIAQAAEISKSAAERSVDALAAATELSVANVSQHLQVLAGARLVDSRREAQRVLYRLADPSVEALWQMLRLTAKRRLAELDAVAREYLVHRDELEPIDRAELTKRMRAGTVTLIDVRPVEEFTQGHLPGAVSVPLDEVKPGNNITIQLKKLMLPQAAAKAPAADAQGLMKKLSLSLAK